jgi:transcriptional regulator with XRE-family HTH domain
MPKRDPLLFGGSAGSIDVAFLESVLAAGETDNSEEARLVERWREACRALTGYVAEHHPGLRQPPSLRADLDRALPGALDSPWVAMYGLNRGLALRMLAVLRQDLAPQVPPLIPPAASLALAQELWRDGTDWGPRLARIEAALDRAPMSAPERVREALGLSEAELARLFGVTRQAVAQWQEFPAAKRAKAATVLSIADLLTYRLKAGRLPMIARKPAAAYGGLSLLDMIAADRHEELLRLTRESFDFGATA